MRDIKKYKDRIMSGCEWRRGVAPINQMPMPVIPLAPMLGKWADMKADACTHPRKEQEYCSSNCPALDEEAKP